MGTEPSAHPVCQVCGSAHAEGAHLECAARQSSDDGWTSTELRPLTALFADVVGSTSLGERLSVEEVSAVVGECVTRMCQIIESFGGTVGALMGDGIAAFFGLEAAQEDDVLRAARAAVRILTMVRAYSDEVRQAWNVRGFDVRIGVNGGLVAVDSAGGLSEQRVALGDAVNVAARLQAVARPGTILVGPQSAEALRREFAMERLGPLQLRGREASVETWRLLGPESGGADPADGPFVGRHLELKAISDLLEALESGCGSIVNVVGEAGIGKSRLIRESIRTRSALTVLEGKCVSHGSQRALAPFAEILRGWLGINEASAALLARIRLRARLGALGLGTDELAFLSRLLFAESDLPEATQLASLPPEAVLDGIISSYRQWIVKLSAAAPVVLIIEDVHWLDRASLQCCEELLALVDDTPVMFVISIRPEPAGKHDLLPLRALVLSEFPHKTVEVPLRPLSASESRSLIDSLASPVLPDHHRQRIVSRAAGVPLFIEQLVSSCSSLLGQGAPGESFDDHLPPAIEGVLVARIDRLPRNARRVAQAAAVWGGKSFAPALLAKALGGRDIAADIRTLLRANLIELVSRHPEIEYRFRHGLLQDAALLTLTEAQLVSLHCEIGSTLERLYGASAGRSGELGHHFAGGRQHAKAAYYLERAGDEMVQLFQNDAALEYWAMAQDSAGRCGSAQVWCVLAEKRARLLARTGRFLEAGAQFLKAARRYASREDRVQAFALAGWAFLDGGDYNAAKSASMLADQMARQRTSLVHAKLLCASLELARGNRSRALELFVEVESLGVPLDTEQRAYINSIRLTIASLRRDAQALEKWGKEGLRIAKESGSVPRLAEAEADYSAVLTMLGKVQESVALGWQALERAEECGAVGALAPASSYLALALTCAGRLAEAKEVITAQMGRERAAPQQLLVPSAAAAVALELGDWATVDEAFLSAIECTRRYGDGYGHDTSAVGVCYAEARWLGELEEEALLVFGDIAQRCVERGDARWPRVVALVRLAQGHALRGEIASAETMLAEVERLKDGLHVVERPGIWRLLGCVRETIARGSGREAFHASLEGCRKLGIRLDLARTLSAMVSHGCADDPEAARAEALQIFEECGAPPDPEHIDLSPSGCSRRNLAHFSSQTSQA